MKHSAEYKRFTALVDRVLAVPHSVIKQRVEEHRKQAALNPNRPAVEFDTVRLRDGVPAIS